MADMGSPVPEGRTIVARAFKAGSDTIFGKTVPEGRLQQITCAGEFADPIRILRLRLCFAFAKHNLRSG